MFKSQIFALSLFIAMECSTLSRSISLTITREAVTQSPDNLATPWGTSNDAVANGEEFVLENLIETVKGTR